MGAPTEAQHQRVAPRDRALEEESFSHLQLTIRQFKKHKIAVSGGIVLLCFYLVGAFAEFVAPYGSNSRWISYISAPPQLPHFIDGEGRFHMRPFVYGRKQVMDPETWARTYVPDTEQRFPIYFLARGEPYKLWGLFSTDVHLFGVESDQPMFLFGSDSRGRDLLSRIVYGTRISLSVGLLGVALSLVIGVILGSVSGLYGGTVDSIIQRVIEVLLSIPSIPLWLGLSASLPADWDPIKVYFAITVILSLLGWTSVARVVRGKFLQLKSEDFVTSARALGASQARIIAKYLIPNFISYVIVAVTLSVPGMILAETSLSFLGLGLRAPVVSWGVLLQDASNFRSVVLHPWLLTPGIFVVFAVLAFNFFGDGLRDAADPYSIDSR